MTCTRLSSNGPSAPSLDQVLAGKIGGNSRFRSLQIGVSQESFGGADPEEHELGGSEPAAASRGDSASAVRPAVRRQGPGLGQPQAEHSRRARRRRALLRKGLPKEDEMRLDEHLSSIRDLERAIASLPPDYQKVTAPEEDFDMKDWPRVAKLQSDMLAYAFATGQTRVASYMLTKCQGLGPLSLAWPHRRAPPRLHAQRREGSGRKGRGRPADSPRHLPLARGGVRLPGGEAQIHSGRRPAPCWTTPS